MFTNIELLLKKCIFKSIIFYEKILLNKNICSANIKQNHFIKNRTYVLLLNTNPLNNDFPMFKVYINSRPSLTISKSFYFKRYYYMSECLKTLYGSQNHARINSRSKLIKIIYNKVTFIPRLKSLISSNKDSQYLKYTLILDHLLPFIRAFILRGIIICIIT